MSTLDVYFRDDHCACLSEDKNGKLKFQYLDSWVENARMPVSLTLPLSKTAYGNSQIAAFVANYLPEGDDLRARLERLLHVDATDDFGLLKAIGRESAGALSFWPEGERPESTEKQYTPISLEDFHQWREYAHQQPFQFKGQTLRMSLGGAQAKMALYFDTDDKPYLPQQGAPTSHILKPKIAGCLPSSVHIEYLTMKLATAVLGEKEVPAVDIWQNCYRIRRFDRPRSGKTLRRLHQEDYCLILGRMPKKKYESEHTAENLLASCFAKLDQLGSQGLVAAPALQRLRLLNQVIVNVLLHNPDAHLKNYALMLKENGLIEVSPMYDSLCTYGMRFTAEGEAWGQTAGPASHTLKLSLRIGNAVDINQVSRQDWDIFAKDCGFTAAFVRRRLHTLAEKLSAALPEVINAALAVEPLAEAAANLLNRAVQKQLARLRAD